MKCHKCEKFRDLLLTFETVFQSEISNICELECIRTHDGFRRTNTHLQANFDRLNQEFCQQGACGFKAKFKNV